MRIIGLLVALEGLIVLPMVSPAACHLPRQSAAHLHRCALSSECTSSSAKPACSCSRRRPSTVLGIYTSGFPTPPSGWPFLLVGPRIGSLPRAGSGFGDALALRDDGTSTWGSPPLHSARPCNRCSSSWTPVTGGPNGLAHSTGQPVWFRDHQRQTGLLLSCSPSPCW